MNKFLIRFLFFGVALILLLPLLHGITSLHDRLINDKFKGLTAQSDKVNTIFLGSSATYRGIDPVLFDSLMTGSGILSNSFNVGIPGINMLEMHYVLEEILRMDLPELQTIVLEVSDFSPELVEINIDSWRTIYYHDFGRTVKSLQAIWTSSHSIPEKSRMYLERLSVFSKRLFRTGEAQHIYRTLTHQSDKLQKKDLDKYLAYNGFLCLEDESDKTVDKRLAHFLSPEGQQEYSAVLTDAQKPDKLAKRFHKSRHTTYPILAEMLRMCEERGLSVIFMKPPADGRWSFIANQIKKMQLPIPFFDLNRPKEYPHLFTIDTRFDITHLNRKGATLATGELARLISMGSQQEQNQVTIQNQKHGTN